MSKIHLAFATTEDRPEIYRVRHEVYAKELGQHHTNAEMSLSDKLDSSNEYIVARRDDEILGFISITPPEAGIFSIEKYLDRSAIPIPFDRHTCEIRILTIRRNHRSSELALLLMFAALRWAEWHGMRRVIAMGRKSLLPLYQRIGFHTLETMIRSGAVEFEAMTATVPALRTRLMADEMLHTIAERGLANSAWDLPFPQHDTAEACVHSGESFEAIGEDLGHLTCRTEIISAYVLIELGAERLSSRIIAAGGTEAVLLRAPNRILLLAPL